MAEAGAKVTLTDIDAEGAAREAQRLVDEGYEARSGVCDVSKLDEVAKVFDEHVHAYGGCDIAFANAGLDVGNGFWTPEGDRNPTARSTSTTRPLVQVDRHQPHRRVPHRARGGAGDEGQQASAAAARSSSPARTRPRSTRRSSACRTWPPRPG
jgi:NAD(P)-dependent dehydrogenase (short-subunit alcohol dehydrogenase family)